MTILAFLQNRNFKLNYSFKDYYLNLEEACDIKYPDSSSRIFLRGCKVSFLMFRKYLFAHVCICVKVGQVQVRCTCFNVARQCSIYLVIFLKKLYRTIQNLIVGKVIWIKARFFSPSSWTWILLLYRSVRHTFEGQI